MDGGVRAPLAGDAGIEPADGQGTNLKACPAARETAELRTQIARVAFGVGGRREELNRRPPI